MRVQPSPGPGSTASPICEPRSTDSAESPQPKLSPFHHPNEDQPNRCDNDSKPPSTKSPDSKPTTTTSENTSANTSATNAKPHPRPRQRHVSHMKPKLPTTTAPNPPDNSQQPHQTRQTRRLRVPTVHQLPDPGAALRRETQLETPQHHHSPLISEEPVVAIYRYDNGDNQSASETPVWTTSEFKQEDVASVEHLQYTFGQIETNFSAAKDCWVIVDNLVYEITDYLTASPSLTDTCGTDATEVFQELEIYQQLGVDKDLPEAIWLRGSLKPL